MSAVAVPVQQAPRLDGVLDEAFWATGPPITDLWQHAPTDGGLASERTEVRIAYDENAIYFGFKLFDSEPDLIRRSILHREGRNDQDDHIWIGLDTYHDGRNAYLFEMNSFGTQGDVLITDESMTLDDWNWEGVCRSEARSRYPDPSRGFYLNPIEHRLSVVGQLGRKGRRRGTVSVSKGESYATA